MLPLSNIADNDINHEKNNKYKLPKPIKKQILNPINKKEAIYKKKGIHKKEAIHYDNLYNYDNQILKNEAIWINNLRKY